MTETAVELAPLTVQVPRTLLARLEALAQKAGRNPSWLVREALLEYLEYTEPEVDAVLEAVDELESGTPGIPHEEMVAWLRSWGTEKELPPPR